MIRKITKINKWGDVITSLNALFMINCDWVSMWMSQILLVDLTIGRVKSNLIR